HAELYQQALAEYYDGLAFYYGRYPQAGFYLPRNPAAPRPLLLVVGTDIVTGQKTIFCNYNHFQKELVYSKGKANPQFGDIAYRYINAHGRLSRLPEEIDEELRPANFLYKNLSSGLPVAWGVRASLSIPGVFTPGTIRYIDSYGVERTDLFVDGGVTDNYALAVATHPYIGRCSHILGGNIGNMGPRFHDYGVRNVVEILNRTLLVMGDANVDSNADNNQVERALVTTVDELTKTEVSSVSELAKIPQLLEEGCQLADQFFAFYQNAQGILSIPRLFGHNGAEGRYIVFLPLVEAYDKKVQRVARDSSPEIDPCQEVEQGSAEVRRLVKMAHLSEEQQAIEKAKRSRALGQCEARLTPPPLSGPWGIFKPLATFKAQPGQKPQPLPAFDLFNLLRQLILLILLTFVSLFGLGLWRGVLWLLQLVAPIGNVATQRFDSWHYWLILVTILAGTLWQFLFFFRVLIYEHWVAHGAKLRFRAVEIPVGLALFLLPLTLASPMSAGQDWLSTLALLLLIAFSEGALVFTFYGLGAFIVSVVKQRQSRA
ncbi:MAG TPA: hypothetical protein VH186_08530, partial [Chloroflexia bacterium]|nr:hypothetical protein [Chloroflexia bacterium]